MTCAAITREEATKDRANSLHVPSGRLNAGVRIGCGFSLWRTRKRPCIGGIRLHFHGLLGEGPLTFPIPRLTVFLTRLRVHTVKNEVLL